VLQLLQRGACNNRGGIYTPHPGVLRPAPRWNSDEEPRAAQSRPPPSPCPSRQARQPVRRSCHGSSQLHGPQMKRVADDVLLEAYAQMTALRDQVDPRSDEEG